MLETKEFYDIMNGFERSAKNYLRTGSQGYKRAEKSGWKSQQYYNDGNVNQAFIIYMNGYQHGRLEYLNK